MQLNKKEIEGIIQCQSGVVENVLRKIYLKLKKYINVDKKEAADDEFVLNNMNNMNNITNEEGGLENNNEQNIIVSNKGKSQSMDLGSGSNNKGTMSLNVNNNNNTKNFENDYKAVILYKDKTIIDLKSTLEVNLLY